MFCQAVKGLLSHQADALSAPGQGTGPGTALSAVHTPAAMALIRQDRSILGEEKEDRERQQVLLSDDRDNDLFVDRLVEVKECYEFGSRDKIVNVKGNLRENVSFYQSIGAPDFVLSIIRNGYRLPFVNFPESVILPNNRSARDHSSFVDEALLELLSSGRVIEVADAPFVVNPLSVSVQPSGKKRLILDLRHVNKCLRKYRFRYEDWRVALSYFEKDAYMFSFDLKSGYHHIEIASEYQTFLGFSWTFHRAQDCQYFVFSVLPFGLSTAPYVFTKCVRPLEKYWRLQGVKIAICLDDGLVIENDYRVCKTLSSRIREDLRRVGFVANAEKSIWEPVQSIVWLGFCWNSLNGTLSITERRLNKIFDHIRNITNNYYVLSARKLASFTGKIISTGPVVGNVSRIMTRHCSMSVAAAPDWDSLFKLDQYCINEVEFWKDNIIQGNVRYCFSGTTPNCFVYSDASSTGCGAHMTLNHEYVCHTMWSENERMKSSTWRELYAIEFALRSFCGELKNSRVKWFTDNRAAAKIVEVGSMRYDLQCFALRIFQICLAYKISLDIQWVPRNEVAKVDFISRFIDIDDWQISRSLFLQLETLWGPHTVDCFANHYNFKLSRFFSRFWTPGCAGIDFFVQSLSDENCLVVPPVCLVSNTLHYMFEQKAVGSLVVPFWPSSSFWPLVSRTYANFIVDCRVFSGDGTLEHGRNVNALLGSKRYKGSVMAIRLNFSRH